MDCDWAFGASKGRKDSWYGLMDFFAVVPCGGWMGVTMGVFSSSFFGSSVDEFLAMVARP